MNAPRTAAPPIPSEDGDDTASIDLSVTFFCAVVMLFVFVRFSLDLERPHPATETLRQPPPGVETLAPAWNPLTKRGRVAVLTKGRVAVLNLDALARGLADPALRLDRLTDGAVRQTDRTSPDMGSAPETAVASLTFDPSAPNPLLVRSTHDPAESGDCPDATSSPVMAVWIIEDDADLDQVARWAFECGLRARFEPVPVGTDGLISWRLGRQPANFNAEEVFR